MVGLGRSGNQVGLGWLGVLDGAGPGRAHTQPTQTNLVPRPPQTYHLGTGLFWQVLSGQTLQAAAKDTDTFAAAFVLGVYDQGD